MLHFGHFEFRPRIGTTLNLGDLIERVSRNFDVTLKRAFSLDVAQASDTSCVKCALYKLPVVIFRRFF